MKLSNLYQKNYLSYICLLILILISLYQGFKLTYFNQDYHHSFFILSMYVDSLNNFSFFKDIFLQYGPGQILLFKTLDPFFNINIVTINKINVIIYALNLIILFKIFEKISSAQIAFFGTLIIFLIHPYSIYPWPDYISGICLSIFYYFFINDKNKFNIFICAFFLFLAVFFRSTYLLNISFAILIYFSIFFFFKIKNLIFETSIIFFGTILIYFLFLNYYESLFLWYSESIGFITSYAEDTKEIEIYNKVSKIFGHNGFIFFKIIYYFFRSVVNLLDIRNIPNIFFLITIAINIFFLRKIFKKKSIGNSVNKMLFISILGLSGFIQSLMLMEVFRNINATIGIVISSIYIYKNNLLNLDKKYLKIFSVGFFIYTLILLKNFPLVQINKERYGLLENIYFSEKKKVRVEIKEYYEELSNYLCNIGNISLINISNDFAISYLCGDKFIKNRSSYAPIFLKKIKPKEYERIIIQKKLKNGEILISEKKIIDNKLKLLKKIESQHEAKYLKGYIYIYKINK